jgi:hypothetical protein
MDKLPLTKRLEELKKTGATKAERAAIHTTSSPRPSTLPSEARSSTSAT